MTPRIWAAAASVWTLIYVGSYIALVHGKQNAVLSVYALVVLLAGLLVLPTAMVGATARRTNLMLGALVIYVLATLAALPFGLLLLPALIATARALSKIKRGAAPTEPAAR